MVKGNNGIVAIIQARTGSTRLPGKPMLRIVKKPMLQHVVERVRASCRIDTTILATTTLPEDNLLENFAREVMLPCYRGEAQDVLARYYGAATRFNAKVIVRICGDNPLIDPRIIDEVIKEHLNSSVDYTSNTIKKTFPLGLDTEVFTYSALDRAYKDAKQDYEREHVTPYIYLHPEKFKIRNVANDIDYSYMRWTVDTPEDLGFMRQIYGHFKNDTFTWKDVLHLLEIHPEWLAINQHVQQKAII